MYGAASSNLIPPRHFVTLSFFTCPHSWAKHQKPAKSMIEKFVKLTDHNCACKDLTNFEWEAQTMTGNGSSVNTLKA